MQLLGRGILRKMQVTFDSPVVYHIRLDDEAMLLNNCLGKKITLNYLGQIFCIQCGRKTNKSFHQGYCFPCMNRLTECGFCVIHPEKCKSHSDFCPENDWAHEQCLKSHVVYLANSSGLKVGITRETNLITRWVDQGAVQGIPMFRVSNRYQSGMVEVNLKQYVKDRTNWRKMLSGSVEMLDLSSLRKELLNQADEGLRLVTAGFSADQVEWIVEGGAVKIDYPVIKYPQKLKTLSLDKTPEINGELQGIKGQYLILDAGVINIRKFSGYQVELFC